MQLNDVFDAPQLRIRSLYTAPDSLAQVVNWTYTTDLLDPRRYLTRGQLVMTGMMWRRNPRDSETFVAAVANSGAVALLAGEGLYGYIPDDVLDACKKHGLSLFAVPADVSFASITAYISNTMASDRVARLTASLVRQRELLTDVYKGQLLDDLITRTSSELGRPIWILTATGRVIVEPIEPLGLADIDLVTETSLTAEQVPVTVTDSRGEKLSIFVIAGVEEHRTTAWFLVIAGDWNEWHPSILDSANELAAVAGLYRVQRNGEAFGWSTMADRLIELIDADSEQPETAVYLRQVGLNADGHLAVIAAEFEGKPELQSLAVWLLADAVAHLARPVVGKDHDGHAVAVIPADPTDAIPTGADPLAVVTTALKRAAAGLTNETLRVGTSPVSTTADLGGALRSARYGMRLPSSGDTTSVRINDSEDVTSAVQLLAAVPDQLRTVFVELVLGRLVAHDERYNSQLVSTLRSFLDCGGSWVRTAELSHLHLNTVRYRIARVEELTGRDLSNTADRADLYLALQLI
jgi:hypothetical protein